MKIESGKKYRVVKMFADHDSDCGNLPGEDVKRMLKGYTYDPTFELWFSQKANIGYDVQEVE